MRSTVPTGVAAQATTPVVFWDGYGLEHPSSGVFVHAYALAAAFEPPLPIIIGPPGTASQFRGLRGIEVVELASNRWQRLKPLWPRRVGLAAQAAVHASASTKPYVIHGLSNFNIPLGRSSRQLRRVVTVHDLIPLLAPRTVSVALRTQLAYLLPRAVRAADRIVCVSEWTRATLVARYPFAAEKSVVIPNGRQDRRPTRQPRGNTPGATSALCVARFEPYKRLDWLLELWRRVPPDWRLTLVTDARGLAFCRASAVDLLSAQRLTVLTDVSRHELEAFYAQADVYVHPSLYEGFCLPAGEAMAAGTPVVYQAGSGIDAVAGTDVGFPLPAGAGEEAWVDALQRAVLAKRQPEFAARIAAHVATQPTWKDAARALKTLYNDLT